MKISEDQKLMLRSLEVLVLAPTLVIVASVQGWWLLGLLGWACAVSGTIHAVRMSNDDGRDDSW